MSLDNMNDEALNSSPGAEQWIKPNGGLTQAPEKTEVTAKGWPPSLRDHALHGLIGDITRAITPITEADPAAIHIQALAALGAFVGRGPYVMADGAEHHCNLFTLLIGSTAAGRKGTSWQRVRNIFSYFGQSDEGMAREVNGLSSGEGLKFAVRDAVIDEKDGELTVTDMGVKDKRLLVVESEFVQVLRQCSRPGNTLSSVLRCAFDGQTLQSMTKNDPIIATNHHIVLIGHITAEELRAELTQCDAMNGFANRFVMVCTQRTQLLPFGGGQLPEDIAAGLRLRLGQIKEWAGRMGAREFRFTPAAAELWDRLYRTKLCPLVPIAGLLGAVTARGAAHCLRMSLIYAVADCADAIDDMHVRAAYATWERCFASSEYVFGSASGNKMADDIELELREVFPNGMTRTSIHGLLGNNKRASDVTAALQHLERLGRAEKDRAAYDGKPGRQPEIWIWRDPLSPEFPW